jgi:two-component system LytT family response regulator
MKEKYKTIIIDDEPHAIEVLQILLEKNCKQVEVAGTATKSIEGISLIDHLIPDLVFLDIEMPRMNGFQLLDELHDLHFHLIFTTAYDQYAVKAFRYSALDYLMKPIVAKELIEAINKLPEKSHIEKDHLKVTEENLHTIKSHSIPERIVLPHAKGYTFLKIDEIIYCEAMSSYTKLIIEGKPPLVISKGLGDIEELLKDASFFRAHRQYLINTKKIQELIREDGGCLLLTNGVKIPLARNRKEEFLALIGRV